MADKKRKIEITQDDDESQGMSFDGASATPAIIDDLDDGGGRKPFNLDSSLDLSEAIAAADGSAINNMSVGSVPANNAPANAELFAQFETERAQLKAMVAEANDKYLRTLAEMQNFKRRGEEERSRIIREGNERLIKELLPVLDNFDLAVAAAKKSESYEQLIGGVEAIQRILQETLSKQGVDPIEAIGQPFDPDLHEAVMLEEDSDQPDETVTEELRKGYTLNSRVIRPSLVKVAKAG